uniref:Uncharacterized protein n=1 Tax=Timema shepardi TaxID=629360 RepID=A0A7R9G547_TIMSH|nr:unnamed protein product [Timema shepardi]
MTEGRIRRGKDLVKQDGKMNGFGRGLFPWWLPSTFITWLVTILWEHQESGAEVIRIGCDNVTAFTGAISGRNLVFNDPNLRNHHLFMSNKLRHVWLDAFWIASECNPAEKSSRDETIALLEQEYGTAAVYTQAEAVPCENLPDNKLSYAKSMPEGI